MCYILIAKQLKEPTVLIEQQIRSILKDQADKNADGFFVKNDSEVLRTLDEKAALPRLKDVTLNNLMVHFRWASAGRVTTDNVHGWELGDWTFLHNGGVTDYIKSYGQSRTQEEADSYLFFQDLYLFLQEINQRKDKQVEKVIRDVATSTNFFGRAALYNNVTDKMYLFGDFHVYRFEDAYIIISSAPLSFNNQASRKAHGFEFDYVGESVVGEHETSGIGVIHNFSRPGFQYRYLGLLKDSTYIRPTAQETHTTPTGYQPFPQFPVRDPIIEPVIEQVDELNEGVMDGWQRINGVLRRIPVSHEFRNMMENIANNQTDEDIDLDPDQVSNSEGGHAGIIEQFSPEEVDAAIVQLLQDEFGFIGVDSFTGKDLFLSASGIHDTQEDCCRWGTCRKRDDYSSIDFVNLNNLQGDSLEEILYKKYKPQ